MGFQKTEIKHDTMHIYLQIIGDEQMQAKMPASLEQHDIFMTPS